MTVNDNKLQGLQHSKGKPWWLKKTGADLELVCKKLSVVLTSCSGLWFHTYSLSVNRKSSLKAKGGWSVCTVARRTCTYLGQKKGLVFLFLFFSFSYSFLFFFFLICICVPKLIVCMVRWKAENFLSSPLEGSATLYLTAPGAFV